ncbi:MAG: SRPBCC domain-containing protein [Pseudomonadota bacterium]
MTCTLSLSREFAAPPSKVWRCLTEPELLKEWFAPAPVTVTRVEIEATPGGIFHVVVDVPEMGEMDGGAGCVLEARADERLVWTSALAPGFAPNAAPAEGGFHFTAFTMLAPTKDGTRYTATALHTDAAARAAHEAMGFHDGWGQVADQLGKRAAAL